MSHSGYEWDAKIGTADYLGGKVEGATVGVRAKDYQEEVSTDYVLGAHKKFETMPVISLKLKMQRLEDFLCDYSNSNEYCFVDNVDEDGALSSFTLTMTNGLVDFNYTNCLVNRATLTIPRSGAMMADLEIFAKAKGATTFGSAAHRTEVVMDRTNIDTLSLASTDITGDFLSLAIGVNHKLSPEVYGNSSILPSDIFQGAGLYNIVIERAIKTQVFSQYAVSQDETTLDVQINDNQGVSVKTLMSFDNLVITDTKEQHTGLGMIIERIEGNCRSIDLAAGS